MYKFPSLLLLLFVSIITTLQSQCMDSEQLPNFISKVSSSIHSQKSAHTLELEEFITSIFQYLSLCDIYSVRACKTQFSKSIGIII